MLAEEYLTLAAKTLEQNGLIAYPTEAVYGLGCLPEANQSVGRILTMKQRHISQGMILVAADFSQLERYVDKSQLHDFDQIHASWPGPVTWILPASSSAPEGIRAEDDTVAVRVSACAEVIQICDRVGAVVSTSANPKGEAPARSSLVVERYFTGLIDYVIPGEIENEASVSEIRDSRTGQILRPFQERQQGSEI